MINATWRNETELKKRTPLRAVFLTIYFVMLVLLPLAAMATGESVSSIGHAKTGPFVDKLIFKMILEGEEREIEALVNNEIDAIDNAIFPEYLSQLENAENGTTRMTDSSSSPCDGELSKNRCPDYYSLRKPSIRSLSSL